MKNPGVYDLNPVCMKICRKEHTWWNYSKHTSVHTKRIIHVMTYLKQSNINEGFCSSSIISLLSLCLPHSNLAFYFASFDVSYGKYSNYISNFYIYRQATPTDTNYYWFILCITMKHLFNIPMVNCKVFLQYLWRETIRLSVYVLEKTNCFSL